MSFDSTRYRSLFRSDAIGWPMRVFAELDSTNSWCKAADADADAHGTVCLAEHQTAGRGQYHRPWVSGTGLNLTFSLLLKPDRSSGIALVTQLAALALVEVLHAEGYPEARIKWPNDVEVSNRKIAGILVECVYQGSRLSKVVVGIGWNIHQTEFAEDLRYRATSMALLRPGADHDREALLAAFMRHFSRRYAQWERRDAALRADLAHHVAGVGSWCHIRVNRIPLNDPVKILGVDEEGHLMVLNEQLRPIVYTFEDVRIDLPVDHL
jgi:BirA family transcriptional regulator, biotin operon repressor / biotin---[acetyl-CoA-carboxylase] ligase